MPIYPWVMLSFISKQTFAEEAMFAAIGSMQSLVFSLLVRKLIEVFAEWQILILSYFAMNYDLHPRFYCALIKAVMVLSF